MRPRSCTKEVLRDLSIIMELSIKVDMTDDCGHYLVFKTS